MTDALHSQPARYARIVEHAHEGIWEVALDGASRFANSRMAELLGYERSALEAGNCLDFVFPEDVEAAREQLALRARGDRRSFDWRWRARDGSEVWTRATCSPVRDEHGVTIGALGFFSDQSGLRRHATLASSEERFRATLDTLLDAVAILSSVRDESGRIVDFRFEYVNPVACASNQLPLERHLGRRLLELLPAHRDDGLFDEYAKVVETGVPLAKEMLSYEDGYGEDRVRARRWFDVRASRLGDGFVCAWRDVTARRESEQRAAQSSERLRRAVELAPFPIMVHAEDGEVLALNEVWLTLTGYRRDELPTIEAWTRLAYGVARAPVKAHIERLYALDARLDEGEFELRTAHGELRTWSFSSAPLGRDETGRRLVISIAHDVTERSRHEQALRESEQHFRSMADAAPALLWVSDDTGTCTFLSRAWAEYTGIDARRGLGVGWTEPVHPDDREAAWRQFEAATRRPAPFRIEYRLRRADGAWRWVHDAGRPRFDDAGRFLGFVGSVIDVHEQRIAAEALREADGRKNDFLAMLGHELRSPLAPIANVVELLRVSGHDRELHEQALQILDRQVAHLVRLVDDLLDVARIVRGSLELRPQRVDLGRIVRETLEDHGAGFRARGLQLERELSEAPLPIEADATRLSQVLRNLLHNAGKFTDPGGVVTVSLRAVEGVGELQVTDTGCGIDPERLSTLFESSDRGFDAQRGGLGLGLAIARGLVERHGGTIAVRSEGTGRGTRVTVRLPLLPGPSQ